MSRPEISTQVRSMTGFSSLEGELRESRIRIEVKTLNHRFLDIKLRLPRDLASIENPLRSLIQARLSRGAVDLKIDRQGCADEAATVIHPNLALAANYYEAIRAIQKTLGLTDSVRSIDIASLPEVLSRASADAPAEELWNSIEPLVQDALSKLQEMRRTEGAALEITLREGLDELEGKIALLRQSRAACESAYKEKIRARVKSIFEAYPMSESSAQAVLESRIAQELALLLDRTDIEEELTRFQGHIDHFRKVLNAGGPVGRKLDFILQELHREINTLGNKAQDFGISEEVVQMKVRLEQLREQVMNLE